MAAPAAGLRVELGDLRQRRLSVVSVPDQRGEWSMARSRVEVARPRRRLVRAMSP
jgi:hypothetical protein